MSEIIFFASGKCFFQCRREVRAPDKNVMPEDYDTGFGIAEAAER